MNHVLLFVQGLGLGLAIAAPVGPIGVLCIQRTLNHGATVGLLTGLGAATADAIYGAVAAAGLIAAMQIMVDSGPWLRLGGGAVLLWLGVRAWQAGQHQERPVATAPSTRPATAVAAYATGLVLTLSNPATILSFATIFAGIGGDIVGTADGSAGLVWLVVGVGLGSAAWWLALSQATARLGRRLSATGIRWIDRISGTALCLFGLVILGDLAVEVYGP